MGLALLRSDSAAEWYDLLRTSASRGAHLRSKARSGDITVASKEA